MGGWTGIPRARRDTGGLGQDVVAAVGYLAQLFEKFDYARLNVGDENLWSVGAWFAQWPGVSGIWAPRRTP